MKTTTTLAALLLIASTVLVASPQTAALQNCITTHDAVTIALNNLLGLTPEEARDALESLGCPQDGIRTAICMLFGPAFCGEFLSPIEVRAAGLHVTVSFWDGVIDVRDSCWRTPVRGALDCRTG